MKISFELNKEDMWIFGKYVTFKNLNFKFKLIRNIVLFAIIIFIYAAFSKFSLKALVISEIAIIFSYVYMQYAVIKSKLLKAYSSKGVYIGKHTLEVDENGIKELLPVGEDFHEWNNYINIKQNNKYIYVFWEANVGNIIPKRAFSSQSDIDSFYNMILSKIE